jgi:hypothetical protein
MNRLFPILILLTIFFSACTKRAEIKIINLKVQIEVTPRFSWQLISGERNQWQSAYEIQLFTDAEKLKTGKPEWTTGKVKSSESILVEGKGISLNAAQTYFWRVKIWDAENRESEWSEPAVFETGLPGAEDWKNAKWIGFEQLPAEEKMVPGVHGNGDKLGDLCTDRPVVPLFRKTFETKGEIKNATLYITGLGHYEAVINGQKPGNHFLAPGWTNYDKSILYNIFDVTDLLKNGENVIGATVGNGFFNINRERYRKLVIAWGNQMMIAQLRIRYADETEQTIVTGDDWKTTPSPITFSSIYGGEDYDAQLEQPGWDQPGFDDSAWKNTVTVQPPAGKLVPETDYPLEIKETFQVKNIIPLNDGSYLYDFGQNASGIIELRVKGKKGTVVKLTPSELITAEDQPNQSATGSPYTFSYTLKGEGVETWQPKFTYYGFRYVKVEGAVPSGTSGEKNAELVELKMLHNRNSAPETGTFSCSYELFNRTFDLINYAIKSNFQSVLTDCPHREKLGWLEQTHLMGSSVHFNFDIHELYRKQVNDMMEAQLPNGLVPDIAPEFVPFEGGFRDSPEWGSAAVILPWLVYKWYGDISVMQKAWPMMTKYVEYLKSKSEDHIVLHGLGDWFDYGPRQPGEAQLTPKALTATAIYYYDVKLLAEMAGILHKTEEQKQFESWGADIKTAFNQRFFNAEKGIISTGSQTSMAMPLCVGLVDDAEKNKVLQNLEDSIRAQGKPLTAGDVGFRYLVEALTYGGKSQLLFDMNARDDVPGYGFQLKKGATALTESWPALENVSNNHLMLGHLMDWFYAGLAGIRQSENSVAYKEIVIYPEMVNGISQAKASFQSPYGEIISGWEKTGDQIKMEITIPVNTEALIFIPAENETLVTESGKPLEKCSDIEITEHKNGRLICRVGSGQYSFVVDKK